MDKRYYTTIEASSFDKGLLYVVFSVLGLSFGFFLLKATLWILSFPMIPKKGPFLLINSLNNYWTILTVGILGLILGVIFSHQLFQNMMTLNINHEEVQITIGKRYYEYPKNTISSLYVSNSKLIIINETGEVVLQETIAYSPHKVAQAFQNHHYPWRDSAQPSSPHTMNT
ncbi:hypothetical protein A374_05776 [Fictibacillus macauensis ZFHKF-1]|uniref:YqeB PH domain-containing protein n=1 Tax=Fictibacillus macauensis ZFHKF-1 TaxID=1196324 RepID=I8AKV0_9BACL|nr:hypothetical protein [Fictibacillus macauensis]EIT86447.1 hypothetical protein A374_05776 [Fictibacillus macauensis ZFHKF-1]